MFNISSYATTAIANDITDTVQGCASISSQNFIIPDEARVYHPSPHTAVIPSPHTAVIPSPGLQSHLKPKELSSFESCGFALVCLKGLICMHVLP